MSHKETHSIKEVLSEKKTLKDTALEIIKKIPYVYWSFYGVLYLQRVERGKDAENYW